MNDSDKDAPAIVDTLAAYVRENAGNHRHRAGMFDSIEQTDIRAVLSVISNKRITINAKSEQIDFKSSNFSGLNLFQCQFENCDIRLGNFSSSFLNTSRFNNCSLRLAKFSEAKTTRAVFSHCDLAHAKFDSIAFMLAQFTGCSFYKIDLSKMLGSKNSTTIDILYQNFSHKTETTLPEGMEPPDHWSEADMSTPEGRKQYEREWEDFKKKMGVE